MYGKRKNQKHLSNGNKPKSPMYDNLFHLWETSIDNDVNDILSNYTGKQKNGNKPKNDTDNH